MRQGLPGADSSGIATRGIGARSDPGAARPASVAHARGRCCMTRLLVVALVWASLCSTGWAQDAASALPKAGSDPSKLPATVPVQPFTSPPTDQQAAQCGPGGVQCG